ncbi:hypothetical protein OK18_11685 [Chryseobacterium gallinarum]|uniref:Phosphoenolpyruvate synthase n=1 Tax=Chryseobacterium gallinarum TaxID=1324352 RepID=A0A0G3M1Z2_CHRGL|nr:PEP/pyruvate-binding domain-containing protein [Chryseobacterium gallinarum]AKK73191.1 hypothetical protein OK18_11685 [Chryseobacterium gallinarum]
MAIDLYKATTKSLVGNKAFNLMKVAKAGIAVPPGFVVNSAENLSDKKLIKLYDKFISHGKASVRSSSDKEDGEKKSAAGIYKTLLDVSSAEIGISLQAVREYSRKSKNIPVIVQKQIDPKMSGVAFSINPVNGDNDIYIEYNKGRCENIVSGSIIPKTVSLKKKSYEDNGDIPLTLYEYIIRLEMIFKEPVDIEWCIDHDEKVWILQCRAITVIPSDSFRYAWSTHEPLWAMEQAFKTRCEDEENESSELYLHREIIYSRDSSGAFDCYIGLNDHISALKYSMKVLSKQYDDIDPIECIERPKSFSKDTAIDYFKLLSSHYCKYIRYYMRSEPIVTDIIERKLLLRWSHNEIAELLSAGNDDLMFREQEDFSSLNDNSDCSILNHINKYPYLAINYKTKKEMIEGVRGQYKIKDKNKNKNKKDNFQLNLDSDLIFLKKLSIERMNVKKGWAGVYFYMLELMEWIYENYNVSQSDLYQYYLTDDIVALIKNNIKLSQAEKNKRNLGVLMKRKKNKQMTPRIYFGKSFESNYSPTPLLNSILFGIPSLNRNVHGIVKVINYKSIVDPQDYIDKIIVTEMTQPNMVALFRKCKGIITDEGGILSHVCILSREYNIPCIVGTSNSTKILQDGDEIIMWADGHISYE